MFLIALIQSMSTDKPLSQAQIDLVKAVQSRDIAKLRRFMNGPIRLQIVWDATGDSFEKALAQKFSPNQLKLLDPPRQVSSGTLKSTTDPQSTRKWLEPFTNNLSLTKMKNPDRNIFYQKDGKREIIGQMVNDDLTETLEIQTTLNGKIYLKRMIIEGHGSGFDDDWFNRTFDN